MKHNDCTHLIEDVSFCSIHVLKVEGFSVTRSTVRNTDCLIKSRCNVDGHDWEIQFVAAPFEAHVHEFWVALVLVYLSAPCEGVELHVHLSCRLLDLSFDLDPLAALEMPRLVEFKRPMDCSPPIHLARGMIGDDVLVPPPGHHLIRGGSFFTVECTINVRHHRDPNSVSVPSSDLHQHLGELLKNQSGVDVTFAVSGESISAHKSILAARSPIFKAEFFGNMLERSSQCVEIQGMHPTVFKAMLHYIYTDKVPELENNNKQPAETEEETAVMAQHLLVAADRYGLDRLKAICEERLTLDISVGTVASTLALAEKHNLTQLKARCIDFISGGSGENLKAVLETEGYIHLEASNPSLLTELLMAAHGKKRKQCYLGGCLDYY